MLKIEIALAGATNGIGFGYGIVMKQRKKNYSCGTEDEKSVDVA